MERKKFEIKLEVILDPADDVVNVCETIAEAIPWNSTEVLSWDYTFMGIEEGEEGNDGE